MGNSKPDRLAYSHLPTVLRSQTHPILLRTLEPGDNAALAAILSDPRNTEFESDEVPRKMELATASRTIVLMRDSASQPTIVSAATGRVALGPGRVNLVVVCLDGGGERVVGLSGFGAVKVLDEAGVNPVPPPEEAAERSAAAATMRVGDVGAMINFEYRYRGFAAEAVRLSVEWGFRAAAQGGLQLDRITACTLADNRPMVALLEKRLGWKAARRSADEGKTGGYPWSASPRDEVWFELTAAKWEREKFGLETGSA